MPPLIATVFDSKQDHPYSLLYRGSIHNALMRLFPPDFFFCESKEFIIELQNLLPIFKWTQWEENSQTISLFLLTQHRHNAVKFFYEMISRWLLPGQRLHISSFFATDFNFPEFSSELYTISEMVICLESMQDIRRVRSYFPIIESEIKLGLVSVYHANRILEIKGLSADEKTSLIQERIASLLERRPKDFDHDIFNQMQHFLVMCGEEFKAARSYSHMTRIIYVFYLFHKMLCDQMEKDPENRFVFVKLSKTQLHLPLGVKKVLGVFVGLNFLNDNEMFEQRHIAGVLQSLFSGIRPIEESYFASSFKEVKIHMLYLEIEKEDGKELCLEEMRALRAKLPDAVRNGVEKLKRPLFMPRNEEEVMRNIITLSQQLRYAKDLPQVIISFDEQMQWDLSFTIIFLRIIHGSEMSIQDLFEKAHTSLKFIPDRVKKIGMVRKKYAKEATVFHVIISARDYIRPDHSVDLLKARQAILMQLQKIVGEVRDYNGGMIAKQYEQLSSLKALFPILEKREDLLLENLFHSIYPVELRSMLKPSLIKTFFNLFLGLIDEKEGYKIKQEKEAIFFVLFYKNPLIKQNLNKNISKLHLSSAQLISISSAVFETFYFGYILCETDPERQEKFVTLIRRSLDI